LQKGQSISDEVPIPTGDMKKRSFAAGQGTSARSGNTVTHAFSASLSSAFASASDILAVVHQVSPATQ